MKTSPFEYDLLVIGAGSGGVRASRIAAAAGARVAVVEKQALGGTCVNVGCVPKKLFVYSAHFSELFQEARGFGWRTSTPEFNWITLRDNKTCEITRLNIVYENILQEAGITLIRGLGCLVDPHTVTINGIHHTAKRILLTPGSKAFVPNVPGSKHAITSDQAFYLEKFPKKIIIVGGGYIAVEFASIFNGLGAETILAYRREKLLHGFDDDICHHLTTELQKKGIHCRCNSTVTRIEKKDTKTLCVHWHDGKKSEADHIMYATGRIPNTDNLDLDVLNIATHTNGSIIVNTNYQTNIPSIYALGDVIGGQQLTPIALAEAKHFAAHVFSQNPTPMDYTNIPTAIFSLPNVATVGITEAQARTQGHDVRIYKTQFRQLKHTLTSCQEKVFMKLIVNASDDRVVGCHMIGPDAGEVIQGLAVAIKAGAKKAIFDQTIGIHPSIAEEFVTMNTPT